MVEISYPPPTRNISPQWLELKPKTTIQRIFDPTSYGATATGFRYYGPLSRFDHQNTAKPELSRERGIIYAGLSLSCCLIEIFGDDETIKIQQQSLERFADRRSSDWRSQSIAYITLKSSLKLLDIRKSGAWDAGSVASMAIDGRRKLTQAWSRYFYERPDLYGDVEGIIFDNAHNGQAAIALYERASSKLLNSDISVLDLSDPTIIESVFAIASRLNLLVDVEED